MLVATGLHAVEICARELMLFAAVGLLIGGLDELAIDLFWIARALWRRLVVRRRHPCATAASLVPPIAPGRIAVFVPAWREGPVIAQMLETALARFDHRNYRIYIGCYPNDLETLVAIRPIAGRDHRVRPVLNLRPGPTTKADALNACWRALLADEEQWGCRAKAVVLHDAEDIVHSAELRLFDTLIERFDLVQLPVFPLPDPSSRWIGGTYMDEFAEAHGKTLVVREAMGAGMPSAGVGCAVARAVLARAAALHDAGPFQEESLTEDYELGLRVAEAGGRGIFVRMRAAPGEGLVAVRAYFPGSMEAAIRQKARWMVGIALAGWDRLGWSGGLGERWMRLRDRRALLSAIVIFASYAALAAQSALWVGDGLAGRAGAPLSTPMLVLVEANALLLGWRLAMRWMFVRDAYGAREAWRSLPRVLVSNFIAVLAARRAVTRYLAMRRAGAVEWDKTDHAFPAIVPAE